MIERLKNWAHIIKQDVHALCLASRDPRVPWYAKAMGLLVAGYALSPIDLIPDFIPVLGYADDLVIVPLGIWLAVSLIPQEVMAEYRIKADQVLQHPRNNVAAVAIVATWIFLLAALTWAVLKRQAV